MELQNLVLESGEVLESEFGIKPEKSKYMVYSINDWNNFLKRTNSHQDSHGVYLPRSLSAHLNKDSKYLAVNLLHEYFGHGLFCEHSLIGKNIVSLDRQIRDMEKEMLGINKLPENQHIQVIVPKEIAEGYNKRKNNFLTYFKSFEREYEGFGYWLEYFLSKATNQESLFEQEMNELVHPDYKKLFEQVHTFSEEKGSFVLIAQLGFPKYYDKNTIVDTLRKLYKNEFDSIGLAIIYGSQKPYSDIDLFVVSDKIQSFYNSWLDIYARNPEEFKSDLTNLSIAVTDPLFTGKIIIGDSGYQELLKQQILNQPITQEAIIYNIQQSEEQRRIALMYPKGSKEREIGLSYQQSFRRNAEELQKGNKIFTLQ